MTTLASCGVSKISPLKSSSRNDPHEKVAYGLVATLVRRKRDPGLAGVRNGLEDSSVGERETRRSL
jgi:hypothetical protein